MNPAPEMLKLIAPIRMLFSLDSSLIAAQPLEYNNFLRRLHAAFEEPGHPLKSRIHSGLEVEVNLPFRQTGTKVKSRYSSLDDAGSLYVSPRVMTVRFTPQELRQVEQMTRDAMTEADRAVAPFSRLFRPDVRTLSISFHDNSIAILSLDLPMNRAKVGGGEHEWDKLDKWTTHLINEIVFALYPGYLFPLLRAVTAFCHESGPRFVLEIMQYMIFLDLIGDPLKPYSDLEQRFMLMWVNRTLVCGQDYPVNHWTRGIFRKSGIIRLPNADVHLNWGNNLVLIHDLAKDPQLGTLWEDMQSAQYYYAAMDAVSINLVKYIGITFNRQTSQTLRRLSQVMEIIVNSVTILQVRYKDISMELQGQAREVFNHLQHEWNFETMVANVQSKLDLCKGNLTNLNQETANRNQGRTEIVLTGLAGLSILNLMVELSAYASQVPPENRGMVGDFPGFMTLGFTVPHNVLGWIGIALALAVVVFTGVNRRWG